MGRISEQDIERVREATDLVSLIAERVMLQQKGRLYWGLCPFHAEKTPSFKVDPSTQLWHCFGCSEGGDAYGFLMRTESLEFPEAVRTLAERAHVEIHEEEGGVPRSRRERLVAINAAAAAFYHRYLTASPDAKPAQAREYLARRGFGSDVAKRWELGYAPGRGALVRHLSAEGFADDELLEANIGVGSVGNVRDRFYERIMFPIVDVQGRHIGFGGRILGEGEPKYLNTQETPVFSKGRNLYGIERAKTAIVAEGGAVVVEGYTDVIAMHEAGITNAIATLGTALTREHVKLLGRFAKRIVYLFDGDEAGLRAADRATEFIDRTVTPESGREQVELLVAILPGGADPADFVRDAGASAMTEAIADAEPLLRYAIDRRLQGRDLNVPEERARALREAAQVLAPIKESTLAADYANHIADVLQAGAGRGMAVIDTDSVLRAVREARPRPSSADSDEPLAGAETRPAVDTAQLKAERELLGLLILHARMRGRARSLLAEDLLTDPRAVRVARAIEEAEGASTSDIVSELEVSDGQAASFASACVLEAAETEDAEPLAEALERQLRIYVLERRIASGKARLRQPEGFDAPSAYDEVFREVSELTRELEELKHLNREWL